MSEGRSASSSRSRPFRSVGAGSREGSDAVPASLALFDVVLIGFFLALVFLLGVFQLRDTADFYWHLRTGDLIRESGEVPRVDFYTYTRAGTPWIDLHWMFQVGMSWVYERGGVPALTFAKCVVTCAAMFLLITARKRTWPIWAMVVAWLPALLVLSGRMYIRPETMTLLYLAFFLAVLTRWDRWPKLAWVLPFVQLAWVNSHGLFILGPIVLGFALIDAALRRGAFSLERRKWWTTVVPASAATVAACLLNPYGIRGALYPLELAATMGSPKFSDTIAELKPIPDFIAQSGWGVVPLQIHFATLALGALSFIVPILSAGVSRVRGSTEGPVDEPRSGRKKKVKDSKAAKSTRVRKAADVDASSEDAWRISVFRLLLFASFSLLSFQATRNSHQFAAVVGSVTAWNFAEWIGAKRRPSRPIDAAAGHVPGVRPRVVALLALILMTFAVGSGGYYAWAGEGRRLGWGEEPLLFPHEAVKFAGRPGTPDRCVTFHNGLASLYIYEYSPKMPGGPGKTVFTDPRLEVTGVDLYSRYLELKSRLSNGDPSGMAELESQGRPAIIVDHENSSEVGAGVLANPRWRCVWFDSIAAVLVHESYREVVDEHEVDFGARHFLPSVDAEPRGTAALIASSKATRNYSNFLGAAGRSDLARPFGWLALDYARRVVAVEPDSLEGWKSIGYTEMIRDTAGPAARCRVPFDPIFDLSPARATYALKRASAISPDDFLTLALLQQTYQNREMLESLRPVLARIARLSPINLRQRGVIEAAGPMLDELGRRLAQPAPTSWRNLDELQRAVDRELELGRVETAVRLLESAYPPGKADWNVVDRLSTLLLHLGEPEQARRHLQAAVDLPRSALRDARLAACSLVEGRFEEARELYLKAIDAEPDLFEARYGLAVLEQDDARADGALEQAMAAAGCAPSDAGRGASQALAAAVRKYAEPVRSGDAGR
jgi:hypothetical protein